MRRLLFTVADRFWIRGRGVVLVPGIIPQGDEKFRIGDPLLLRRPDGSTIDTTISGLEMFTESMQPDIPVFLKDLCKEDVPIGTEVWSVAGDAARQ